MPPSPRARQTTMRHAGFSLLLLLLLAPAASAHAVLGSADPAPNSHVDAGVVTSVTIRFTEGVEREYTDADVIDTQGVSQKTGPIAFDPVEDNVIHVPVRTLESGLYSASWKALSVDTHTTRGTFVFAVGNATLRPGEYEPTLDVSSQGEVARDGFARFAFYAGLFLAGGMPLFAIVVLREAPPRALFTTAAIFGLVGVVGALVGLLFLESRTGLGLGGAIGTAPGRSFVGRALLLALATGANALAARSARWRGAATGAVALGALACIATALGSHAASVRENTTLYVVADVAHLLAALVWVGGIAALLHALPGRTSSDASQLVFRFGALAVPSVVLLLATGTLASVAHMPCIPEGPAACASALRTERYMQLVLLKILLMVPLVALGAINKMSVGPRLARGGWTPQGFRRIVQAEAIVMALIVGAAGVLAATSPPNEDPESGAPTTPPIYEVQNTTAKSHLILQVSPNPVTIGVQRVVIIVHPLGPTLPNGTLVALKIWQESEEEPEITINPKKVTPNEWEIEDGFFTSEGTWHVMVILQRSDEYVKRVFDVPVVSPKPQTAS